MGEGRKAFEESLGLEGLHVERERREKGEHKLEREEEWKLNDAYKWGSSLLK